MHPGVSALFCLEMKLCIHILKVRMKLSNFRQTWLSSPKSGMEGFQQFKQSEEGKEKKVSRHRAAHKVCRFKIVDSLPHPACLFRKEIGDEEH